VVQKYKNIFKLEKNYVLFAKFFLFHRILNKKSHSSINSE